MQSHEHHGDSGEPDLDHPEANSRSGGPFGPPEPCATRQRASQPRSRTDSCSAPILTKCSRALPSPRTRSVRERAYIGVKEAFDQEVQALSRALAEMNMADALGGMPIDVVLGPDLYLLVEETGLEEVIEGRLPLPRLARPFMLGLSATPPNDNPTLVNNVETLANVAHILANRPDWLRSNGTDGSPGTMVFTVCGDVRREGVFELALGGESPSIGESRCIQEEPPPTRRRPDPRCRRVQARKRCRGVRAGPPPAPGVRLPIDMASRRPRVQGPPAPRCRPVLATEP